MIASGPYKGYETTPAEDLTAADRALDGLTVTDDDFWKRVALAHTRVALADAKMTGSLRR